MFAKVFGQIFDSSIAEDYTVRHMFIDLLVLADSTGAVDMTLDAISRRTNVPIEIVKRCINGLCEPDPESRSPLHEGKRLIPLDSHREWGWQIVNYGHYRKIRDEEIRRSYFRDHQRAYRLRIAKGKKKSVVKDKMVDNGGQGLSKVDTGGLLPSPSSSVSKKEEKSTDKRRAVSDSEWLQSLVEDKTYEGIDVPREHGKMIRWCSMNGKEPTRRRFVNWLNRADKRLSSPASANIERHYEQPPREITDEEREKNRQIASEAIAKLKKQFRHE